MAEIYRRWPNGASKEYIESRNELLKAEWELREQTERVAAMRRALPTGAIMKDYTFSERSASGSIKSTTLADLFGPKKTLVVYHFMFAPEDDKPCSMCSMWVDGFNGVNEHLREHFEFVVVGKAPVEKLEKWSKLRGWNVRILSSNGVSFNADMNVEDVDWSSAKGQQSGISVFQKDNDQVRHVYTTTPNFGPKAERGIDLLSPVWNVMDLTPEGRGKWYPNYSYILTEEED